MAISEQKTDLQLRADAAQAEINLILAKYDLALMPTISIQDLKTQSPIIKVGGKKQEAKVSPVIPVTAEEKPHDQNGKTPDPVPANA